MTGVADDGQVRHASSQLYGNLPHGKVAINLLLVAGEAAVYGSQTLYACLIDALHSSYPQLQVGINRILHKDGDVHSLQTVGYRLHGKGIGRGTRSNPKDVNVVLKGKLYMLRCCHLCGDEHACLLLHALQPRQRCLAVALEATRLGARFPHSRTKHSESVRSQLACCCHHLLLGLSRARSCYNERAVIAAR